MAEQQLASDSLANDPRVQQARELLLEAVREHQAKIDHVQLPNPALVEGYSRDLESLAKARGGKTYFPYLASGLGNGPWVELADGSVKLDFITGIGVHGLGHSHPSLIAAGITGALADTVMQGNLQHNQASREVAEMMVHLSRQQGATLEHCLLTTSGAMANENALKIALHHRQPADRIIALDNCFAGRSIATAQLTDRPHYRDGLPTALAVDYIPPADPEHSEESMDRSLAALDKHLRRHPGKYAAIWLELVAGEGGYYPGSTEYFNRLIDRAKQDDILIIFDEVQTFGRLSKPFAFQHFGLDSSADIVTVGKITQLCATLYRGDLKPKSPILSQTFTASSGAIEACRATLEEMQARNCFGATGSNMSLHDYFAAGLANLAKTHPAKIAGPFGCGMMIAFTPLDGSSEAANQLTKKMFELGLMGFVAGGDPSRIRFLPPPAATQKKHIDAALKIIEAAIA